MLTPLLAQDSKPVTRAESRDEVLQRGRVSWLQQLKLPAEGHKVHKERVEVRMHVHLHHIPEVGPVQMCQCVEQVQEDPLHQEHIPFGKSTT